MITTRDMDQSSVHSRLSDAAQLSIGPRSTLSADSFDRHTISNGPLRYHYSGAGVESKVLDLLQTLSDDQSVVDLYTSLIDGDPINLSENRTVSHHDCRNLDSTTTQQTLSRITQFAQEIRSGHYRAYTDRPFQRVVQIGIGGSRLGPEAIATALTQISPPKLPIDFLSNVDFASANRVVPIDALDSTLFIVVSKSGGTLETSELLSWLCDRARGAGVDMAQFSQNIVTITQEGSPLDTDEIARTRFTIPASVGGRFSALSPVGLVANTIGFGETMMRELLDGAHQMDIAARSPVAKDNMSLMTALIGVWHRSYLGRSAKAVISYADGLSAFGLHLQQLDCESNGKSVNRYGQALSYPTGPLIIPGVGTDVQHSFFQWIHQGSDCIPVEFIAFLDSPSRSMNANLAAQYVALACGRDSESGTTQFDGNRPVTMIMADTLSPASIGALFAHYENVVMFQGFLWNLNSFDQPGVELGKTLASQILNNAIEDPLLAAVWTTTSPLRTR